MDEAQRFTELWERYASRVMAYALRHVDPDVAQDVVADTFVVAWRRLGRVPDPPLPWLLVVALNTIANHRRSGNREAQLREQLSRAQRVAEPARAADVSVVERAEALAALASLTATEREAILLIAWDGLTPSQAARVAGCSLPAFYVRLFRARRRLQADAPAEEQASMVALSAALFTKESA